MVTRRITDSVGPVGFDLAGVEAFCASMRDNGADGADPIRARMSVRGRIRSLSVAVPVEEHGESRDGVGPAVVLPMPSPGDDRDDWRDVRRDTRADDAED